MIIIGEKLNSSIPSTLEAFNNRDEDHIIKLIKSQAASGADYLDINTALTGEHEVDNMLWVIELALENADCGIMIDSPNPDVIIQCMPKGGNRSLIVNSITLEKKYDAMIAVLKENHAGVVCLPINEKSIPETAEERLAHAKEMVEKLHAANISHQNIYMDVLIEAIATNANTAITTLNTVTLMKKHFPKINTICGLSNVSFGLPNRAKLNSAFLTMAMQKGLDSAILDITNKDIKNTFLTSNALLGKDEYCLEYIQHARREINKGLKG